MSSEGFSLPPSAFLHPSLRPERVPHLWPLWRCFSAQNGFTSTKNVLIIFIFYYTTRKLCQLGSQSSGHTEEGERAGEKK